MFRITLAFFWLSILLSSSTAIRPWLSLTISDWAFVIGLLFSFVDVARILATGLRKTRPLYYTGALLVVLAALTSGWSRLLAEDIYLYTLKAVFTFFIYIPILGWAAADRKTLERFRDAWIYSGAIAGVCAALQYRNGGYFLGNEAVFGRMTGLTEHPNELGLLCAIVLPQVIQKMIAEKEAWRLILNLTLMALSCVGLMLSVSMTGLICGALAIVASVGFSIWNAKTRRRALTVGFSVIIAAVPVAFVMGDTINDFADRISFTRGGEKQTTLDTRLLGVQEVVMQSGGINVLGSGVYAVLDAEGNAVHNMYLRAGVELGLFGMLGLILITGVLLAIAIQGVRSAGPSEIEYKTGLLVSYSVLLVGGQASPVLMQRNLWLPGMFILAPNPAQTVGTTRPRRPHPRAMERR